MFPKELHIISPVTGDGMPDSLLAFVEEKALDEQLPCLYVKCFPALLTL